MEGRRIPLTTILAGALATLIGMTVGGPPGEWVASVGSMALPGAILAFAVPPERRGRARALPAALGASLVVGVVVWRLLPTGSPIAGWPLATWFAVSTLGVVPFALVAWGVIAGFGDGTDDGRDDGGGGR